ncbi:MAG: 3-isopropylmalate dehydratase large subunit [Candidatus Bathyarchaeota archaeon]|nr:MAG: 3-isopropylmalate dehydratase large subunit [Candidatus Bathyarchaeota archaeon]
MNLIEALLAKAADERTVSPGDIVDARIDHVMINDITAPLAIDVFREMGGEKVWDPTKVTVVLDHLIPANDEKAANLHRTCRTFALKQNTHFYDVGRGGVCHQIMMENHVKPGEVIVGADSHTCTYGAIGAFATGIGSTEAAAVMLTGQLWFKVPPVINIIIDNTLKYPVTPKDLILHVIGQLKADGATYMGVHFSGEAFKNISIDGRMTICNMVVEMGGKCGIVEPDVKVIDYMKAKHHTPFNIMKSDPNAEYFNTIEFDASKVEPVVASPYVVDNVKPISELETIEIDQALIGSCTNGRLEDLQIAAQIFRGKQVKKGVRALIIPASKSVYMAAMNEGLIETFINADVMVCNPACGPCYGGHLGLLSDGEICVSTTNRNFVGRMGSPSSKVYLASPATVAASAITGIITDPRNLGV